MSNTHKNECSEQQHHIIVKPIQILITFANALEIEHRRPVQVRRKLRFVGQIVEKQTNLPEEIQQELKGNMLTETIKADEFLKVAIESTDPGGTPSPIDEDEPIRHIVEEGTVRVVTAPALEAGKRYIYFVPSSAGNNTGVTVVDGEPGSGQTFIEERWAITVTPAVAPATNVGLTTATKGKQTSLPQEIKDLLAPEEPPV